MKRLSLAVLLVFAMSGSLACAAEITVLNSGFESPAGVASGTQDAMPDSWTQYGSWAGLANVSGMDIAAPPDATSQAFWANAAPVAAGSFQVLTETLSANMLYTLTVDVGHRSGVDFGSGAINLGYGATQGANLLTAATISNSTPEAGQWTTWTSTFVTAANPAGLGELLRVEVGATGGVQTLFDNVRLTSAAVPEPSAMVLGLSALVGLIAYAWRKRR
jgi:hypothetical protein